MDLSPRAAAVAASVMVVAACTRSGASGPPGDAGDDVASPPPLWSDASPPPPAPNACADGWYSCQGSCHSNKSYNGCGPCGDGCGAGELCVYALPGHPCVPTCDDAGTSIECLVDGSMECVDLRSDPAHCGTCDVVCGAGQTCTSWACSN